MTSADIGSKPAARPAISHGPFSLGGAAEAFARTMSWAVESKGRLFWILQILGWTSFFIVHLLSGIGWQQRAADFYDYSLAATLSGFFFTSFVMRPAYKAVWDRSPWVVVAIVIAICAVGAVTLTALKTYFHIHLVDSADVESILSKPLMSRLWDAQFNTYILLSWTGGYFGVNYYMMLRDQRERAIRSAQLADQAQLKMLRYQLNPHFLFNTLNAISTLVLEKDSKAANEMLTRLGAFLRYSLDSDPLQTTTLSEELRALDLYLNIEKARFQDRLRIRIDAEPDVRDAMIPSMLLQPAVENAIKYAIAMREEGGSIEIIARKKGDRLEIAICDDGPGVDGDPSRIVGRGHGVGLANMRDRLRHVFGENQSFRVENLSPNGFAVILEAPLDPDAMDGTAS